jgi:hypothetical protein
MAGCCSTRAHSTLFGPTRVTAPVFRDRFAGAAGIQPPSQAAGFDELQTSRLGRPGQLRPRNARANSVASESRTSLLRGARA